MKRLCDLFNAGASKKEVGNHGQEGKEEGCEEGEALDQAQVSLSV
jgi:hypothetical protein